MWTSVYCTNNTKKVQYTRKITGADMRQRKGREEMKSKKLISLICAAAMTASVMAGLAVNVSAASDPVWSYDGDGTTGWTSVGTMTNETDDNGDKYIMFTSQSSAASGSVLALPAEAQLTDDYVIDFDVNIETGDGMGRIGQYTQLAFTGSTPTSDTQDYGDPYASAAQEALPPLPDTEHGWNTGSLTGIGYMGNIATSITSRPELGGNWIINYSGKDAEVTDGDVKVADDYWVRVRSVVKGGKATVTVADGTKTLLEKEFDADATKLTNLYLALGRSDTVLFTPAVRSAIKLDNIAIYSGAANAPEFSTESLRGYVAPEPEEAAPGLEAPSSADVKVNETFNEIANKTIIQTADSVETAITDDISVVMGGKEDSSSNVIIGEYATGDKILTMNGGRFAHAGRGPVLYFANDLAEEVADEKGVALAFAVKISKSSEDGAGRLYFIKDTTKEGTDGQGAYRNVAAVLTTVEDEVINRSEGNQISTYVTPDEWHTVAFVITGTTFRVYVDGATEADIKGEYVAAGDNASRLEALPMLTAVSKSASNDATSDFSIVRIDNLITYTVDDASDLKKILPSVTEPTEPIYDINAIVSTKLNTVTIAADDDYTFDALLIHAKYDENGVLTSAKQYNVTGITQAGKDTEVSDLADGDKLFVWSGVTRKSGLKPYAEVVTVGALR